MSAPLKVCNKKEGKVLVCALQAHFLIDRWQFEKGLSGTRNLKVRLWAGSVILNWLSTVVILKISVTYGIGFI